MVTNAYFDPEVVAEIIDDTRLWQATHRHILKHLWAANADRIAAETACDINQVVLDQVDRMQATLPNTMSARVKSEVRAKIFVIGADVLDVVHRNGQRK